MQWERSARNSCPQLLATKPLPSPPPLPFLLQKIYWWGETRLTKLQPLVLWAAQECFDLPTATSSPQPATLSYARDPLAPPTAQGPIFTKTSGGVSPLLQGAMWGRCGVGTLTSAQKIWLRPRSAGPTTLEFRQNRHPPGEILLPSRPPFPGGVSRSVEPLIFVKSGTSHPRVASW